MTRHLQPLTPNRRRLVELMLQMRFGHLEQLTVRDGDPVFSPATRQVFEEKLAGSNSAGSADSLEQVARKPQTLKLFARFEAIGSGQIARLEIKDGLPFRVYWEDSPA